LKRGSGNNGAALRLLLRRLVLTIPVLLGVATLVFSLIDLIPGDPAQALALRLRAAARLPDDEAAFAAVLRSLL